MIRTALVTVCITIMVAALPSIASAQDKPRPYRLPALSDEHFKDPIIWGATAESPDGKYALSFGGHDQTNEDGLGHTRVKVNGEWVGIDEDLRRKNPHQSLREQLVQLTTRQAKLLAATRRAFFEAAAGESRKTLREDQLALLADVQNLAESLAAKSKSDRGTDRSNPAIVLDLLDDKALTETIKRVDDIGGSDLPLLAMSNLLRRLDQAAQIVAAEPSPRALSPVVFDPKTGLFVLFGGDHLDYLTNDTWTFDPRTRTWEYRYTKNAPPPRANHKLTFVRDGVIKLTGGYIYTSNTDYVGGQYIDHNDGEWYFEIEKNEWTNPHANAMPAEPFTRTYRTGPFDPAFYLADPMPDRASVTDKLASLPVNTWVSMKPPHLPRLNRDWGTAVLDPERDLFLRFSGGHSAHGGSDVLHYHLATNRWELTFPVEFPLGQLYSNTSYPGGFNFNRRPWVTGHTYKGYAVDPVSNQMLFVGHDKHTYYYNPLLGDWSGRKLKPSGMSYNGCFYTLLMCPVPSGVKRGIVCWTQHGHLFHYDGAADEWTELKLSGDKLPGSVVDRAGIAYDSKRDHVICFRKEYRGPFNGIIYTVDVKTNEVNEVTPGGAGAMTDVDFLREPVYDPKHDIVFLGVNMPLEAGQPRRSPAYDCATNRWVAIELAGDDPNGKEGRNVSLGLVYDARRGLYWAVDTNSNVYVLKLDLKTAKVDPL